MPESVVHKWRRTDPWKGNHSRYSIWLFEFNKRIILESAMKALVAHDVVVPMPQVRVHLQRCDLIWLATGIVHPVLVAVATALRSPERTLRHGILQIAPVRAVHVCQDLGVYTHTLFREAENKCLIRFQIRGNTSRGFSTLTQQQSTLAQRPGKSLSILTFPYSVSDPAL